MVCKKCRKENNPDMKFCGTCGTPVPVSELNKRNVKEPSCLFVFKGIKFHTPDEDRASVTMGRLILDANILLKSLAALLLLAFFLPIFRVVISGENYAYNLTGFDVSFGWEANYGTFFGFFVFAIPILIFCVLQFRKGIAKYAPFLRDRFFLIVIIFAVLGPLFIFLAHRGLNAPYLTVWPFWGFFTLLLLYVLIGATAVGLIIAKSRK